MKYYDALKAREYIKAREQEIDSADLGMQEDWSWTAETIFENGMFMVELEEKEIEVAGITGSYWATPVLHVSYKDGKSETIPCFFEDSDSVSPEKIREMKFIAEATGGMDFKD